MPNTKGRLIPRAAAAAAAALHSFVCLFLLSLHCCRAPAAVQGLHQRIRFCCKIVPQAGIAALHEQRRVANLVSTDLALVALHGPVIAEIAVSSLGSIWLKLKCGSWFPWRMRIRSPSSQAAQPEVCRCNPRRAPAEREGSYPPHAAACAPALCARLSGLTGSHAAQKGQGRWRGDADAYRHRQRGQVRAATVRPGQGGGEQQSAWAHQIATCGWTARHARCAARIEQQHSTQRSVDPWQTCYPSNHALHGTLAGASPRSAGRSARRAAQLSRLVRGALPAIQDLPHVSQGDSQMHQQQLGSGSYEESGLHPSCSSGQAVCLAVARATWPLPLRPAPPQNQPRSSPREQLWPDAQLPCSIMASFTGSGLV